MKDLEHEMGSVCNPGYEILTTERLREANEKLEAVYKRLDKMQKELDDNTVYRLKAEGIMGFMKWVGFSNLITIIGGIILYFSK